MCPRTRHQAQYLHVLAQELTGGRPASWGRGGEKGRVLSGETAAGSWRAAVAAARPRSGAARVVGGARGAQPRRGGGGGGAPAAVGGGDAGGGRGGGGGGSHGGRGAGCGARHVWRGGGRRGEQGGVRAAAAPEARGARRTPQDGGRGRPGG